MPTQSSSAIWGLISITPPTAAKNYRIADYSEHLYCRFGFEKKNSARFKIRFYTVLMSNKKPPVLSSTTLLTMVIWAIWITLPSASVWAQTNSIEQISTAVQSYLEQLHEADLARDQRMEIEVGYLDPRLNLPVCPTELEVQLNGNQRQIGKLQVKVSCLSNNPWSKYIPAEVNVYGYVAVASTSLNRGSLLQAHDIEMDEVNLANLRRSPVFDAESLVGMEMKYPLTSGGAFSMEAVRQPMVIERGDMVQLIAETRNLSIRQQGEALQNGAVGSVINVRNSSSDRVVQAEVLSQGRVKVKL